MKTCVVYEPSPILLIKSVMNTPETEQSRTCVIPAVDYRYVRQRSVG